MYHGERDKNSPHRRADEATQREAKEVRGWRSLLVHIVGQWYDVGISAHGAAVSWLRSVIVG